MGIPMLKIRRPVGRLIFNMGIAIPSKMVFLIETAPWTQDLNLKVHWGHGKGYDEITSCIISWIRRVNPDWSLALLSRTCNSSLQDCFIPLWMILGTPPGKDSQENCQLILSCCPDWQETALVHQHWNYFSANLYYHTHMIAWLIHIHLSILWYHTHTKVWFSHLWYLWYHQQKHDLLIYTV